MFSNENDGKIFKFAAVVIFIISAFLFVKYAVESNIYRKQVYLLYTDIVHGKDLVADILPPPAYIIESYLAAYEMRENINNPAKSDQIAQYIRDRLMRDYLNSYDYWKKNTIYIITALFQPLLFIYQTLQMTARSYASSALKSLKS